MSYDEHLISQAGGDGEPVERDLSFAAHCEGYGLEWLDAPVVSTSHLASIEAEIDAELQDAEPSNYEEDNYDAGYIAGLTFAQDLLRAALESKP